MTRYELLPIGTRVKTVYGYHAYGYVASYEHYNPHQVTFPVRVGGRTWVVTSVDVEVLPESQQPPNRKPPRRTGNHQVPASSREE